MNRLFTCIVSAIIILVLGCHGKEYSDADMVDFARAARDVADARNAEQIKDACLQIIAAFDALYARGDGEISREMIERLLGRSLSTNGKSLYYIFMAPGAVSGYSLEFHVDWRGKAYKCDLGNFIQ